MWATEMRICEECGAEFSASKFAHPRDAAKLCKNCIEKQAGIPKRYRQYGRGRKAPNIDALMPEFSQAVTEYHDEKNFIHTKYVTDFIRANAEKFPILNKFTPDYALNRKLNQCFAKSNDFELHRLTRGRHAGPIWKRISE